MRHENPAMTANTIDPFRSASALAADLRAGAIGCRALLEVYIERIARFNPVLNAIIATDFDGARQRADEADAALARGELRGPLHGVPMTVKESYDLEGFVTSWGSPAFKDNRPGQSAVSVRRLIAAGANVFGKTNVPLFLGDLQTYNALYGTTANPLAIERTPGGSSGGAAAALAAGLTALEAGSDIASSIRTPAHYCGLYGHKPTFGLVTTSGQRVAGKIGVTDLSVVGPMARSAADLSLALQIMAGPDDVDALAWRVELPAPRRQRLADFRIAVMLDAPHAEVDGEIQALIQQLAEAAGRAGASLSFTARPRFDTEEADRLFRRLLESALSGRVPDAQFEAMAESARQLAPDERSPAAQFLRDTTLSHRDWLAANETRHRMRLAWRAFFDDFDLLLCPAAASTAPLHQHQGEPFTRPILVNGKRVPLGSQLFWAGYAGLAYLPATVAPAGRSAQGLPVGVQIIGPQYGDLTCIHFARLLEESYLGFARPPGYD
jgi:amidase